MLLAAGTAAQVGDGPTLKDAYKKRFQIGVVINHSIATGEGSFNRSAELVKKDIVLTNEQFNQISPENDLKWASIHPREGADGAGIVGIAHPHNRTRC
jgi:GH35 family endo-1,4-beta-xylanase